MISLRSIALHAGLGFVLGLVLRALGSPLFAALAAAAACGLVREYSEPDAAGRPWSDFRLVSGGPWNGLADVAAWLLGTGLWWVARHG